MAAVGGSWGEDSGASGGSAISLVKGKLCRASGSRRASGTHGYIYVCIISNLLQSWRSRPGSSEKGLEKNPEEGVCLRRLAWNKHVAWLKCFAE